MIFRPLRYPVTPEASLASRHKSLVESDPRERRCKPGLAMNPCLRCGSVHLHLATSPSRCISHPEGDCFVCGGKRNKNYLRSNTKYLERPDYLSRSRLLHCLCYNQSQQNTSLALCHADHSDLSKPFAFLFRTEECANGALQALRGWREVSLLSRKLIHRSCQCAVSAVELWDFNVRIMLSTLAVQCKSRNRSTLATTKWRTLR